jgi:hypothetical protein
VSLGLALLFWLCVALLITIGLLAIAVTMRGKD